VIGMRRYLILITLTVIYHHHHLHLRHCTMGYI